MQLQFNFEAKSHPIFLCSIELMRVFDVIKHPYEIFIDHGLYYIYSIIY